MFFLLNMGDIRYGTLPERTLLGTNISPTKALLTFEDDFPFPQVGYVSSLEGIWGKA